MNSNPAHVIQIVGHEDEGKSVHFNIYTHDVGLKALEETVNRLQYNFDIDEMKEKDPAFNKFINRWKLIELERKKGCGPQ